MYWGALHPSQKAQEVSGAGQSPNWDQQQGLLRVWLLRNKKHGVIMLTLSEQACLGGLAGLCPKVHFTEAGFLPGEKSCPPPPAGSLHFGGSLPLRLEAPPTPNNATAAPAPGSSDLSGVLHPRLSAGNWGHFFMVNCIKVSINLAAEGKAGDLCRVERSFSRRRRRRRLLTSRMTDAPFLCSGKPKPKPKPQPCCLLAAFAAAWPSASASWSPPSGRSSRSAGSASFASLILVTIQRRSPSRPASCGCGLRKSLWTLALQERAACSHIFGGRFHRAAAGGIPLPRRRQQPAGLGFRLGGGGGGQARRGGCVRPSPFPSRQPSSGQRKETKVPKLSGRNDFIESLLLPNIVIVV